MIRIDKAGHHTTDQRHGHGAGNSSQLGDCNSGNHQDRSQSSDKSRHTVQVVYTAGIDNLEDLLKYWLYNCVAEHAQRTSNGAYDNGERSAHSIAGSTDCHTAGKCRVGHITDGDFPFPENQDKQVCGGCYGKLGEQ